MSRVAASKAKILYKAGDSLAFLGAEILKVLNIDDTISY